MKATKSIVQMLAASALVCGVSTTARAQIGSGWTQYTTTKTIQRVGTGTYSSSGGIETFTITKQSGEQRCEARYHNDYTSGQRQFEGYVKVTSGTHKTCVYQTKGGTTSTTGFMLVCHNVSGGQLRHYDNEVMASGVYGVWLRWNTIHDANANKVTAYVNGANKGTFADHGNGTHYNKVGVYNIGGTRSQSQWRNVRFWRK